MTNTGTSNDCTAAVNQGRTQERVVSTYTAVTTHRTVRHAELLTAAAVVWLTNWPMKKERRDTRLYVSVGFTFALYHLLQMSRVRATRIFLHFSLSRTRVIPSCQRPPACSSDGGRAKKMFKYPVLTTRFYSHPRVVGGGPWQGNSHSGGSAKA